MLSDSILRHSLLDIRFYSFFFDQTSRLPKAGKLLMSAMVLNLNRSFHIHHQQTERDWTGRRTGGHHGNFFRSGVKLPSKHGGNRRQTIGPLAITHPAAGPLFDVVEICGSYTNGLPNFSCSYRFTAAHDGVVAHAGYIVAHRLGEGRFANAAAPAVQLPVSTRRCMRSTSRMAGLTVRPSRATTPTSAISRS